MTTDYIEHTAKLFSAGSYPDRGIDVSEEDLDRIAQAHKPVPIKVEHTDTPLRIGTLERIWRTGKDLFGKLMLSKSAWQLIKESNARGLSVAIKRDKSGLTEVSLVRKPRIADAVLFAEDVVLFSFEIEEGEETDMEAAQFSQRIAELEKELKTREIDTKIDSLKRSGKLIPASESFARAILSAGDTHVVSFSDGTEKPLAETFLAFLDAQPKVVEFSELAEGSSSEDDLSEAEREFYGKLGVTPEAARKHRGR